MIRFEQAKTVDAVYYASYLAPATMEPINATADVRADSYEVSSDILARMIVQSRVANELGIAPEKVKTNNTVFGGSVQKTAERCRR